MLSGLYYRFKPFLLAFYLRTEGEKTCHLHFSRAWLLAS